MRASLSRLIACVLLFIQPAATFGWGPAGHRIVASIAFGQLTPAEQGKIVAILNSHPRFKEDFKAKMPPGVEEKEWLFQQAAIWPDLQKALKLAPKQKAKFNCPLWHYIGIPYYPTKEYEDALTSKFSINISFDAPKAANKTMNLVQATKCAQKILADPNAAAADKALYLSWLFHLVGDAHQPLHATTLCIPKLFPKGDHGGNWIPTEQHKNLHLLWDSLPGSSGMKFNGIRSRVAALLSQQSLQVAGEAAAKDLDVVSWAKETHALAESDAYTREVLDHLGGHTDRKHLPKLDLNGKYLKNAGAVSKKQLVVAGYRLGAMLKEIAKR